jgi:hypothetical protein
MEEFKLTLFLLLILLGLINAVPPYRRLALVLIMAGLMLAFIPPSINLFVPWSLVIDLTIPVLIWQNARRLINARWESSWLGIAYWLVITISYTLIFTAGDISAWSGAFLLALLVSSVIWRVGENEEVTNIFSQIGPIMLIFLLVEITPEMVFSPQYFGDLFSGAAIGVLTALIAVFLIQKINHPARYWIALGQVYFGYWLAGLMGASAIAAALISVSVFVILGLNLGILSADKLRPAPLNTPAGFGFLLLLFLFLGWQAHQELTGLTIFQVLFGSLLGVFLAYIGLRLDLFAVNHVNTTWLAGIRVGIFLLPTLLLWPHAIPQLPALLLIAMILTALVLVAVARVTLPGFLEKKNGESGSSP